LKIGVSAVTVVIRTDAPPIREDESGSLRVGNTRVLLELVVEEFQDGATPEAIVQQFPTLALSDVYAVIGYYLRHREEIEAYLRLREDLAEQVRKRTEAAQGDLSDIRQRLLAHSQG
jgi:uncharacterized protein (DUF433 family)